MSQYSLYVLCFLLYFIYIFLLTFWSAQETCGMFISLSFNPTTFLFFITLYPLSYRQPPLPLKRVSYLRGGGVLVV